MSISEKHEVIQNHMQVGIELIKLCVLPASESIVLILRVPAGREVLVVSHTRSPVFASQRAVRDLITP